MSNTEMIIVLDFGSRYSQLLARTIRELGVYSELRSRKLSAEEIKQLNPKGIILSGDPSRTDTYDEEILNLDIPVLGLGSGVQLMMRHFAGKQAEPERQTYETRTIEIDESAALFKGTPKSQEVWTSKNELTIDVSASFKIDGQTVEQKAIAISHIEKPLFGLQFYPEVTESEYGANILKNFLFEVCKCTGSWTTEAFIEKEIENIKTQVGDRKVLCALSG